jgi:hypothetical protein
MCVLLPLTRHRDILFARRRISFVRQKESYPKKNWKILGFSEVKGHTKKRNRWREGEPNRRQAASSLERPEEVLVNPSRQGQDFLVACCDQMHVLFGDVDRDGPFWRPCLDQDLRSFRSSCFCVSM